MNIVFFTHPSFINSRSMSRFAEMMAEGMKNKEHSVKVWAPQARFAKLKAPQILKKWLGYIDQYIVFPLEIREQIKSCPPNTLFVITDNALGPWVPLVKNMLHVIHCNDFLAQRSALNEIQENKTSWTGRQYQAYIRRGYRTGNRFISISQRTKEDLNLFLTHKPILNEVVYLGLNSSFEPNNPVEAQSKIAKIANNDIGIGYVLHVGGNQWYKNRTGVIEIYDAWRQRSKLRLSLILLGEKPSINLSERANISPFSSDIHFLSGMNVDFLRLAYAGATVLLFPSLAEGFGWPIAEAMASGCPVITTDETPMTEVAGDAGFFIPRRPSSEHDNGSWAVEASKVLEKVIQLSAIERKEAIDAGLENVKRFDADKYLNKIESIYLDILQNTNQA